VVDCYEPGSTFKVITLSSALNEGAINTGSSFDCVGFKMVDGEKIKCWRSYRPHGHQTLAQAVQNSCNPAFMTMALALGKDKFYQYIYNYGFGASTGIDFVSDEPGIVMHPKYVRNVDLARIGFGQSIAVTPLQLITGISAAVNGGKLMKPYLVKELKDPDGNVVKEYQPTVVRNVISEETSQTVRGLLEGVVKEGSGRNAAIPGYRIGGKTGTAQKYQNGQVMQGKSIASFIGFAPADNPKFAVLILVDEPDVAIDFGSVVAAPYVKKVLESTLKYMGIPPQYSDAEAAQMDKTVNVPNVVGMDGDAAAAELKNNGLQCIQDGTGTVNSQLPGPTATVLENTTVLLYMSQKNPDVGDNAVEVPDLSGKTVLEANAALKLAGLSLKVN
jgi:stage V sporulation protein D (sporulation-specific penicillin-binding protein)